MFLCSDTHFCSFWPKTAPMQRFDDIPVDIHTLFPIHFLKYPHYIILSGKRRGFCVGDIEWDFAQLPPNTSMHTNAKKNTQFMCLA